MLYILICVWLQGFKQSKIHQVTHLRSVHAVLPVHLSFKK